MKNIVIIGAGIAGFDLARQLSKSASFPSSTHRIVLIERNGFAFWPIGALRAAVQPGFENQIMAPLKSPFENDSQHILLAGAQVVSLEKDAVILSKPVSPFMGTRIPFERAVLAMGAEYPFPSRPTSSSVEESKADFRTLQGDVKEAKSILILGGGPIGVEMAGEIKDVYPDQKVTIVAKSKLLIPQVQSQELHDKLQEQLRKVNVDVIMDDAVMLDSKVPTAKKLSSMQTFKTEKGKQIEADLIISAIGTRPETKLIRELQNASQNQSGYIKVHDDLHIDSPDGLLDRIIAIGDVNDVQGGKTAKNAKGQVSVALSTIIRDITQNDTEKATVQLPDSGIVVPFGAKGGASLLPFGVTGEEKTSAIKGQTLFIPMFQGLYA